MPRTLALLALLALLAAGAAQAQTQFFFEADVPYLSVADVPAGFYAGAGPAFLDTLEDDQLDGGLTGSAGSVIGAEDWGSLVDSVASDSAGIGRSWFTINGTAGVRFSFDGGPLPTAFALVVTDASGPVSFTAYGAGGGTLGSIVRTGFQDGGSAGGTAEDRFFGVTDAAGVWAIEVRAAGGGLEVDHLQYGSLAAPVPEPAAGAMALAGLLMLGRRLRRTAPRPLG